MELEMLKHNLIREAPEQKQLLC